MFFIHQGERSVMNNSTLGAIEPPQSQESAKIGIYQNTVKVRMIGTSIHGKPYKQLSIFYSKSRKYTKRMSQ
ncbi:MAG: hypothetical protein R6U96_09335 [Promethearchaeia archaeon]